MTHQFKPGDPILVRAEFVHYGVDARFCFVDVDVDDSCIVSSDAIVPRRHDVVADVIEQDARVFFDDELGRTRVALVAGFHFVDDVMHASVVTLAGTRTVVPVSRLRLTRERDSQS